MLQTFAFRQVDELLVFATGDDVAADTVVAAMTLNLSLLSMLKNFFLRRRPNKLECLFLAMLSGGGKPRGYSMSRAL